MLPNTRYQYQYYSLGYYTCVLIRGPIFANEGHAVGPQK